jgi:ABC-type branched-subunit amino acid transport system permease subunit
MKNIIWGLIGMLAIIALLTFALLAVTTGIYSILIDDFNNLTVFWVFVGSIVLVNVNVVILAAALRTTREEPQMPVKSDD